MISSFLHRLVARRLALALLLICSWTTSWAFLVFGENEHQEAAACQAWSYAVFHSSEPERLPQEWRLQGFRFMSLGLASPLVEVDLFPDSSTYGDSLLRIRESFGNTQPAPENPAYVSAFDACRRLADRVIAESQRAVEASKREGPQADKLGVGK